ncbi:phage portal protein [Lachnoclostridium sp. An14]|uniref:phage portal protein n=1 Tax=Lachnoclostridium sp. An14 TaxID=1965562 RepID=UPI000B369A4A|nr:phage portal protein [Lachnoclostridium sp. An14]OUQ12393.1 phage portal protein [Lachnoclostridium sp. An14]
MSKDKKKKTRAEPKGTKRREKNVVSWLCSSDAYDILTCKGYTSLSQNPEIITAVDKIAKLIGSMTLYLMENRDDGDVRIRNELSRKIDIEPCSSMTRSTFIQWIVRTLYLEGNGNAVVLPVFRRGYLQDLRPQPANTVSLNPLSYWDYQVMLGGTPYEPDEILHFVLNPDSTYPWKGDGYKVALTDVANNLKQAGVTEKGFMESKWKPSIIVKVDAMTDEYSSPEGRRKLLSEYIETGRAGEPWLIPAEQFSVEQVRPLSLADLALSDMVQLDKRTVAAILGVPPFVLGVGDFNREAWNNFISSTIMPIAQAIQQEMTKKLLYSPTLYFRFNPRSLYSYELRDMAAIADDQYVRGIMTANEVRDWLGLSPKDGLNELVILENYIPRGMIADQSKLQNGGET